MISPPLSFLFLLLLSQLSLLKFIRHCSDLLPAPLFGPLMHMLTGLSSSLPSSHHCFNLLKANSPSLGGGGPSATISLDHFFDSLHNYYLGLRQGSGVRSTPSGCAISPQELEGLMAVLKLIRTIANLVSSLPSLPPSHSPFPSSLPSTLPPIFPPHPIFLPPSST